MHGSEGWVGGRGVSGARCAVDRSSPTARPRHAPLPPSLLPSPPLPPRAHLAVLLLLLRGGRHCACCTTLSTTNRLVLESGGHGASTTTSPTLHSFFSSCAAYFEVLRVRFL